MQLAAALERPAGAIAINPGRAPDAAAHRLCIRQRHLLRSGGRHFLLSPSMFFRLPPAAQKDCHMEASEPGRRDAQSIDPQEESFQENFA